MTNENKIQYLNLYKELKEQITESNEEIEILDTKLQSIKGLTISDMPRGGGSHVTMEDLISDKIELEKQLEDILKRIDSIKLEITKSIFDGLEDPNEQKVLYDFYIECKNINKIGKELNLTFKEVKSIFDSAIDNIKIK